MAESESASALTGSQGADDSKAVEYEEPIGPSSVRKGDPEKEPQAHVAEANPPDGGAVAWLVVFGVWCCTFCSFGWINCRSTA
jgi:hypothetical protein